MSSPAETASRRQRYGEGKFPGAGDAEKLFRRGSVPAGSSFSAIRWNSPLPFDAVGAAAGVHSPRCVLA